MNTPTPTPFPADEWQMGGSKEPGLAGLGHHGSGGRACTPSMPSSTHGKGRGQRPALRLRAQRRVYGEPVRAPQATRCHERLTATEKARPPYAGKQRGGRNHNRGRSPKGMFA